MSEKLSLRQREAIERQIARHNAKVKAQSVPAKKSIWQKIVSLFR